MLLNVMNVINESFQEKKYFNEICRLTLRCNVCRLPTFFNLRDKTPKDWEVRFGKCGQQM